MDELVVELKEIKKLLQFIVSNLEQIEKEIKIDTKSISNLMKNHGL